MTDAKNPPAAAKVFEYLDVLRETGVTNMFGAAPWVANAFDIPVGDAREFLSGWMQTFDADKSPTERAKAMLAERERTS